MTRIIYTGKVRVTASDIKNCSSKSDLFVRVKLTSVLPLPLFCAAGVIKIKHILLAFILQ